MNQLVSDQPAVNGKRSFARPSFTEDEPEERSQAETDTSFFTHDVGCIAFTLDITLFFCNF